MNILFVVNALGKGGAEKIFMDLIKNFNCEKHNITILMIDHYGVYVDQIPNNVNKKYIFEHVQAPEWKKKYYGIKSIIMRFILRKLNADIFYKKVIKEKYDVEIAFLEGEATRLVAQSKNSDSIKYAWVHTDMIKNPWSQKCYPNVKSEYQSYALYDRVLAVSDSVKQSFENKFGLKAQVIYNALDENEVYRKASAFKCEKSEKLRFVTVGRLEEVKGYKRLVTVFSKIAKWYPNIELIIIGEGSEREQLESLIRDCRLENIVFLYGYQANPYPYVKSSDVFVCSSYAEGFSTVVTEALLLGIPVVTTDCAGMRELLGDSQYGLIVENTEEGLHKGIVEMIENVSLRERYCKASIIRGKDFCVRDRICEIETLMQRDFERKTNHRRKIKG